MTPPLWIPKPPDRPARAGRGDVLGLLSRAVSTLELDLGMHDVLRILVELTADLMASPIVSVLLYDEERRVFSLAATQALSHGYREKPPLPSEHSLAGWVLRHREPLAIRDINAEPRYHCRALAAEQGLRGLLCVPLLSQGRAIGVLNSYSREAGNYDEDDVRLLGLMAAQVAAAVHHARLRAFADAQAMERELHETERRAQSILMRRLAMDAAGARRFLRRESRRRRLPVAEVARGIIASEPPAPRPPDART